jgi:hypothetical protein
MLELWKDGILRNPNGGTMECWMRKKPALEFF